MQPRLTGITLYLPNGQVKQFQPAEVIGYGAAPTVVVAVRQGDKVTRYAGFPTVFHEELAAIELVPAEGLQIG